MNSFGHNISSFYLNFIYEESLLQNFEQTFNKTFIRQNCLLGINAESIKKPIEH